MLYTSFPPVSATIFRVLRTCDEMEDRSRYLHFDYSVNCDSSIYTNMQLLAYVMTLFYPIGESPL